MIRGKRSRGRSLNRAMEVRSDLTRIHRAGYDYSVTSEITLTYSKKCGLKYILFVALSSNSGQRARTGNVKMRELPQKRKETVPLTVPIELAEYLLLLPEYFV